MLLDRMAAAAAIEEENVVGDDDFDLPPLFPARSPPVFQESLGRMSREFEDIDLPSRQRFVQDGPPLPVNQQPIAATAVDPAASTRAMIESSVSSGTCMS